MITSVLFAQILGLVACGIGIGAAGLYIYLMY